MGEYIHYCLCNNDRSGPVAGIRDACGIRSPRTVLQRGTDIQEYIRWTLTFERQWWPLDEKVVAEYLNWSEANVKSKLIGKNLIHGLKFFKFVMGGNFNIEKILSPVVTGRSARISATRDPREQARPLTLEELTKLENLQVSCIKLVAQQRESLSSYRMLHQYAECVKLHGHSCGWRLYWTVKGLGPICRAPRSDVASPSGPSRQRRSPVC